MRLVMHRLHIHCTNTHPTLVIKSARRLLQLKQHFSNLLGMADQHPLLCIMACYSTCLCVACNIRCHDTATAATIRTVSLQAHVKRHMWLPPVCSWQLDIVCSCNTLTTVSVWSPTVPTWHTACCSMPTANAHMSSAAKFHRHYISKHMQATAKALLPKALVNVSKRRRAEI